MSDSPWDEFPDNGFLRDSHNFVGYGNLLTALLRRAR